MTKYTECQACNEITLRKIDVSSYQQGHIETWECGECGHTECFSRPVVEVHPRTTAFQSFLHEIGYDRLDTYSKLDLAEMAFIAGRLWEAKADIKSLKELDPTIIKAQGE